MKMMSSKELIKFYDDRLNRILNIHLEMIMNEKELSSVDKIEQLEIIKSIINTKNEKVRKRVK